MRILIATALLLGTAPALAQTPASAPAAPKPAKGSPEEVVCHREINTGSLVQGRRTCLTRAQWQAQADATQRDTQSMEERGRITACTSPGGC